MWFVNSMFTSNMAKLTKIHNMTYKHTQKLPKGIHTNTLGKPYLLIVTKQNLSSKSHTHNTSYTISLSHYLFSIHIYAKDIIRFFIIKCL